MRELHLLRLFANHDEQNDTEKNAGGDQHFPVGQTSLQGESEDCDEGRKGQTEKCTLQHHPAAEAQIVTLEEEHNLESLSIQGGESEKNESPPKLFLGN